MSVCLIFVTSGVVSAQEQDNTFLVVFSDYNEEVLHEETVKEDGTPKYNKEPERKAENGAEYEYYAVEPVVPNGYEKTENGLTITNKRSTMPIPTGIRYNTLSWIIMLIGAGAIILLNNRYKRKQIGGDLNELL